MPKRTTIANAIERIVARNTINRPTTATVHRINGRMADIKVGSSILRNIEVVGDVNSLATGQKVNIQWVDRPGSHGPAPIIITGGGSGGSSVVTQQTVPADEVTLTNTNRGMAIKTGGVSLGHLNFTPALAGHTHQDIFQKAGWQVTADGAIFNGGMYIHPSGQISLGTSPNIVKIDSQHATHRIWAGNVDPAQAPFSVSKDGSVHATAGQIAGWNLSANQFSADSGNAKLDSSANPLLGSGWSYHLRPGRYLAGQAQRRRRLQALHRQPGHRVYVLGWRQAGHHRYIRRHGQLDHAGRADLAGR